MEKIIVKSKGKMQKSKLQIKIQNKKDLNFRLRFCFLIIGMLFLPGSVFASNVYIDTSHSSFFVGDTIMFSVRIDSLSKDINAVEGEVLLDHAVDTVSLNSINTSGSLFSLWASRPLPSERNTRISFAGGSPGGLIAKDATIFNIVLKLEKTGQVALSLNNIGVYLNDGKGTKDKVSIKNLVIDVLPKKSDLQSVNDWIDLILNDKTPPEPFEIYLGQEGSVFDGKKFLSFNTIDRESGIKYYEVREGNLPPTRSDGTYVLQNQDKPTKVTVVAYDAAGNARKSVYNPKSSYFNLTVIIVFILLLFVLLVVFKKRKKNDFVQK